MNRAALIQNLQDRKIDIEPDQEVEVGLFRPQDALGVSLAYYEVYGDAFPVEHVYDPEEVILRNATDGQYTIVARTPKGEIVGLMGLFRNAPSPFVYEAGQLMVIASYRKGFLALEITNCAINLQKDLCLPVIFTEAVCNHLVTQRIVKRHKHVVTGLEMECMPADTYSKEANTDVNVSLLLTFQLLNPVSQTVFLPPVYEDIFKELYANLNLTHELGEATDLQGKTESEQFLLPEADLARITVSKMGQDFAAMIDEVLDKVGLVQVYLNLGDPAAPAAVSLLREHGFCFGGLLPLWFGSDGMIMQHLPHEPAWDAPRLYTKAAKSLRDYVRKDYEAVHGSVL